MKRSLLIGLLAATCLAAPFLTPVVAIAADPVDYPDGYRTWTHVKSMTIHKGHPLETPFMGIHHIYANGPALRGLRDGRFDDGAVLAFDLLESVQAGKASLEGERVLLGVLHKDREQFAKTGGWGYEAWSKGDRSQRLVEDGGAGCHGCHTQQRERDFVFSEWRD